MSDPPKVMIKSKVTIDIGSEDETDNNQPSQSTPRRERSSIRSSEVENGGSGGFQRHSKTRKSSKKNDVNVESITLQETAPKSHPVTLKASFLRRKIKEYEGKNQ
jgi:hypothetical protein